MLCFVRCRSLRRQGLAGWRNRRVRPEVWSMMLEGTCMVKLRGVAPMRRAGLTIIALVIGTALTGAAWAQTSGGGGAGASPGGGGAAGAPLGPATPGTAAQSPLNPTTPAGTPSQRSVTGINQNQQLNTTPGAPSDTTGTETGNMPSDAPAGSTTTRTRVGPGTATGRVPKDTNADVASGVEGPGQLSRPTAFELHSGRVPRTP